MRRPDLRAVAHVARNDVRLLLRDRGTVFWSFVGPFMFMIFFGFLFKDSPTKPTAVWLQDPAGATTLGQAVAMLLRDEGVVVNVVAPDSTPPADSYAIVISPGATDTLAAGRPPHVTLRTPNDNPTPRERTLVAQTTRAIMNAYLGLTPADARATLDEATLRARITYEPRVRMERRDIAVPEPSTGFQHTVPAYLVMFLIMTLMTSGAEILVAEQRAGQIRRALVSSLQPGELVLGKFASRFVFAWLQILVMLGAGIAIFGVKFGTHPEALLAVLVALALGATGLGLFFATLFTNPDKASGVGVLLSMAMAALGGCWWPIEIVPKWMRGIAFALPTGWSYDALNRVMALDAGLPGIARHLVVLLGIAAVTIPLASRRIARAG